jgi:hypothetical protein
VECFEERYRVKVTLTLMRVQFEFTRDDLIDVAKRFSARSKVVRSWKWSGMFYSALFAWLLVFAFYYPTPMKGTLIGFVAAVGAALLYPSFHGRETEKRLRKLHQEKLGNENSFVCEVELTQAGFSVSQMNRQIKYDWQAVEEIKDTSDSVDIFTRDGGGVIVRNRAFQSDSDRVRFVELARGFSSQSRS